YDLSVYGPNGFLRSFKGSVGVGAAMLDVVSQYGTKAHGSIAWTITNLANAQADVSVLDAYTGKSTSKLLPPHQTLAYVLQLDRFGGWYDLIVTVSGDASFNYRLAGHVETGKDSISDPALGGLVALKG